MVRLSNRMINGNDNYAAWALLLTELHEAREHLGSVLDKMHSAKGIAESDFAVELGHVYAHLNRAWHTRNQVEEVSAEQWAAFSQFPKDVKPVG